MVIYPIFLWIHSESERYDIPICNMYFKKYVFSNGNCQQHLLLKTSFLLFYDSIAMCQVLNFSLPLHSSILLLMIWCTLESSYMIVQLSYLDILQTIIVHTKYAWTFLLDIHSLKMNSSWKICIVLRNYYLGTYDMYDDMTKKIKL